MYFLEKCYSYYNYILDDPLPWFIGKEQWGHPMSTPCDIVRLTFKIKVMFVNRLYIYNKKGYLEDILNNTKDGAGSV
jgi:hypothetical protein